MSVDGLLPKFLVIYYAAKTGNQINCFEEDGWSMRVNLSACDYGKTMTENFRVFCSCPILIRWHLAESWERLAIWMAIVMLAYGKKRSKLQSR
jgi:hypothetical protein